MATLASGGEGEVVSQVIDRVHGRYRASGTVDESREND